MPSQTGLRYRGTDSRIKEALKQHKTRTQSFDSSTASNSTITQYTIVDGTPTNGTDLCGDKSANICEPFYIQNQDNATVAQGAYSLASTRVPIQDVKRVTAACADKNSLKSYLQSKLNNQQETALGNQSCATAVYSIGRSIHLDNQLIGVSSTVCSELKNTAESFVSPCVQNAVQRAFDGPASTPTPQTSYYDTKRYNINTVLAPIIIFPLITTLFCMRYFCYRSSSTNNRHRYSSRDLELSIPQVNAPEQELQAAAVENTPVVTQTIEDQAIDGQVVRWHL